ncbi:MAG TPA: helix-turn-helix transcriptional regulator [Patescibacteria group bacterium]|nr:helix-turn-helix transcriptional regulator [Patescibacteria group bacterium]
MKIIIDSKNKNIIGPQVKKAREDNHITQEQLSAKLETLAVYIDRASISKIEQQKRIVTDYELMAISQVLKVSAYWLLGIEN